MIDVEISIKALSINKAFVGRRFKTKECKEYEKELWYLLPEKKQIEGNVEMIIEFYLKNDKRTDVSNLVKITEDILTKKKYFEDDRKVYSLCLYKYPSKEDKIHIIINKL